MTRLCSGILLLCLGIAACATEPDAPRADPLEGAWVMVEGTYTTPDTTITMSIPQKKILSDGHFAFGRPNELGAFAGGGRYTYSGGTYTEIIEYHSDTLRVREGRRLIFDARLEGDSVWIHSGAIDSSFHLEERWRRLR